MKKQLLPLILFSLSIGGCSFNPLDWFKKGDEEEQANPGWPNQDIASYLSQNGVNGVTVPQIPTGEFEGGYDEEAGCFVITAPDTGIVGQDSYEDQYYDILIKKGWTIDDSGYDFFGYYAMESTEQVDLIFCTYEEIFTCCVYTNVMGETGEWPYEEVASFLEDFGIEDITVPGLDGDSFYYDVDDEAFCIGSTDRGTVGTDSFEDQYLEVLENAGWAIDDSVYDTYGYLAYEETEKVIVQFYTYEEVFACNIFAEAETTTGEWPYEDVEDYLEELNVEGVSIPGLEGDTFYGYYDSTYGCYTIESADEGEVGADSLEDQYVTVLEEAGWTIDDSVYDEYGYYADEETGQIELQFFTYGGTFMVAIWEGSGSGDDETTHYGTWPTTEINAYLDGLDLGDIPVPSYATGDWYGYINDDETKFTVYADDEDALIYEGYATALEEAGWTIDDTYYDNGSYDAYCGSDYFYITVINWGNTYIYLTYDDCSSFTYRGEWPAEAISSYLSEIECGDVTVPAASGEEWYGDVTEDDYGEYFCLYIEDDGTLFNSYCQTLENAGWELIEEDDGYAIYDDPTEHVEIEIDDYSEGIGNTYIYIYGIEQSGLDESTTDLGNGKYCYTVDFSALEDGTVPDMSNKNVSITIGYGDNTSKNDPLFRDGLARIYWGETVTFSLTGATLDYVQVTYDTNNNGYTLTNGTTQSTDVAETVNLVPTDNTQDLILKVSGTKGSMRVSSFVVYYTLAE